MLRVGLTGSIAVGKSFVSETLAEFGCHVIDADAMARDVVLPGALGLSRIVETFGNSVLHADGALDRAKLGAIVFADEVKRQLLNSILHPFIIALQDKELIELETKYPSGIAVVDAALMIESGGYRRFDKLVVVHCHPEIQLDRLMARSGLTHEEAKARIDSQMSQEEKMSYADYLVNNSSDRSETRRQTEEVYSALLAESSREPGKE